MIYDQVMVDIETTGTNPNHNAMIQLSAVRFNMDGEVDMNMFDECLLIPGNRYWSEETRDWWATQNQDTLRKIWGNMRDPATVLREFQAWVSRDLDSVVPVMWAKPISFEWPFLESYFTEFGVAKPFHYSDVQDLRSWCRARGLPLLDREIEFAGEAHDAIHDVLHQIQTLFTLLKRTEVKVDAA